MSKPEKRAGGGLTRAAQAVAGELLFRVPEEAN
jgi:hypothetical protein